MIEPFDILIRRSYDFKPESYVGNREWLLLKELYNKNFIINEGRNYNNLPKKIHQIWFGGEMPDKYRKYCDTWERLNPEWEYKLWTDKDVDSINLPNRDLFNSISNMGQKSDFFRYHVLNQFGGIYADTDFACLKSFDTLSYLDFIIGIGFPHKVELYIGLIGSVPHHPIIERVIGKMTSVSQNGWLDIFNTTGSYFFTRTFFEVITGYVNGVVALPPDYFYPYPNDKGYRGRCGEKYIKNCSYAIHYWEVSWI